MYVSSSKSEVLGPLSRLLKTQEESLQLGGTLVYTEKPRRLILSVCYGSARSLQHGNSNTTTQNVCPVPWAGNKNLLNIHAKSKRFIQNLVDQCFSLGRRTMEEF